MISRTAFQLKGGGWYADLYASSKPGDGKAAPAEKSEGGKEATGSPAKEAATGGEASSKSGGKAAASESSSSPKKKSAKKAESCAP